MKNHLTFAAVILAASFASATLKDLNSMKAPFTLPALPYAASALEPVIDTETMSIHHGKHHQAYVDNLNKAAGKDKADLKTMLADVSKKEAAVRNNGGGHWNHSFFWTVLAPAAEAQKPTKEFEKEIAKTFGSFKKFQEEFEKKGAGQFGSGWVWLIRNSAGKLEITSTANQDNPLMDVATVKGTPIFALDVWEHAYYLKYQNKRAEYLKNFWKVVNWKQVEAYDKEAQDGTTALN